MAPALAWWAVARLEQGIQVLTHPLRCFAVAIDRPLKQRAADDRLHGAGEATRVALLELAGGDRLLEQLFDLRVHRARMRQGVAMEFRIRQVHLEERQAVGE